MVPPLQKTFELENEIESEEKEDQRK